MLHLIIDSHHQRKRLADNFDTLTEPITGSETKLDSSKQQPQQVIASSSPTQASEAGADGEGDGDSMWKNVPNIQGPAGISTGHTEYNTAGRKRGKRDVESWPSDLENAKNTFNADFKDHHVAATVNYASDILEATE